MKKITVYDLPTRLFHWLFVSLFIGAFFIAKVIDDDSPSYAFHMLLGLLLAFVVCLRIVWGIIGSRYARFSSFSLNPKELIQYFKKVITGKPLQSLGHNPASSWAALIMMSLALGLAVTGYLMTGGGNKESFEDIHELFANAFVIVAITHVAGVAFHTIRHKEWIGMAMMNGKKQAVEGQTGINHTYRGVAVLYLALVGTFAFHLYKNYDVSTQSLHIFGNTLQLGDTEEHHDAD